jgi:hypothetical protein
MCVIAEILVWYCWLFHPHDPGTTPNAFATVHAYLWYLHATQSVSLSEVRALVVESAAGLWVDFVHFLVLWVDFVGRKRSSFVMFWRRSFCSHGTRNPSARSSHCSKCLCDCSRVLVVPPRYSECVSTPRRNFLTKSVS